MKIKKEGIILTLITLILLFSFTITTIIGSSIAYAKIDCGKITKAHSTS